VGLLYVVSKTHSLCKKLVNLSIDAIDTTSFLMPPGAVYIEYEAQTLLDLLNLPRETVDIFRSGCRDFLVEFTQVTMRLPINVKIMNQIEMLSLHNATVQPKTCIISLASHFRGILGRVDATEMELSGKFWLHRMTP
jgi:hypothetical protein